MCKKYKAMTGRQPGVKYTLKKYAILYFNFFIQQNIVHRVFTINTIVPDFGINILK